MGDDRMVERQPGERHAVEKCVGDAQRYLLPDQEVDAEGVGHRQPGHVRPLPSPWERDGGNLVAADYVAGDECCDKRALVARTCDVSEADPVTVNAVTEL